MALLMGKLCSNMFEIVGPAKLIHRHEFRLLCFGFCLLLLATEKCLPKLFVLMVQFLDLFILSLL